MVEASKFLFDQKGCREATCHELIHPWTKDCGHATTSMLLSCITGAYKFYAMVYLIQILAKGKKLGKKELLEQFKLYLKSGIFGLTVGCSFVTLNCIFRKLFYDEFKYHTTVLVPCTLSGLAIYCEPPHRRTLVVNLFVNLVFEYWLRTAEMKGWLRRSPGRETFLFMLGSAVFFYLTRKDKEQKRPTPVFWFFSPPKVSKEVGKPVSGKGRSPACPHEGPCINYVLKGTAQLFGVGCAMTMLRTIIPLLLTPTKAFRALKPSHLKLGMFFGGYIGIYRLIVCLLCRANGRDSPLYALPAGFLAGAAFRASPSTPIALAPFTSSLQILGSWAYGKKMIPENWPLPELLYCVCQGLLFHARVMHEDVCPKYIINLMRTVTSAKADLIQKSFIKKIVKPTA
ncbi:hypothetical protein NE865_09522 [Phthorimaea operculella]|nr:hypothetical protein NE865_09522 [Phthorimaea operculella]